MTDRSTWIEEIDNLQQMVDEGVSLDAIGASYNVSRQRIYQIMTKYGIETPNRKRKNFLRSMPPKYYWLDKMLGIKGITKHDKNRLVQEMDLPDYCPALGIKLNYDGPERSLNGWKSRSDFSPSIDRIDSSKGYTPDNIQVLSWRANRIKNDATPKELEQIARYMREVEQRS